MKRALLIAGGTVGGLGAVLAITPPQLTSSGSINIAGGSAIGSTGTSSSASASSSTSTKAVATANATKTAKPVATKKATPAASATAAATKSATPTAAATTAVATPAAKSGTFTGPAVFVNYGTVQVKITVTNGRVTDAVAVQAPSGRNETAESQPSSFSKSARTNSRWSSASIC